MHHFGSSLRKSLIILPYPLGSGSFACDICVTANIEFIVGNDVGSESAFDLLFSPFALAFI